MTTAETLNKIPEIVAKAIPVTFDFITCPVQRKTAIENAKWRRKELEKRLTTLIIEHEPQGVGITVDLSGLLDEENG